jgi:type I restriction enzyme S subunit
MPSLNQTILGLSPIPLPSIEEQKEIASILSLLDRKIENLRKQNETLEAIAQTLFKHWFVDFEFPNEDGKPYKSSGGEMVRSELGEIPTGWCIGGIENLFDFLEGPGIRNWQYTESGTRFINIRLIQNGNIEVENANFVSDEEANGKYKHFHLKSKDLVISTSGTLGRCAIVREEHLPIILNTSVIRFRPNNQNDYEFMYQLFQSKYFTHNLQSLASGSVQLNFGPMHLRQIKIFIPPRNILDRFSNVAKPIYEKYILNFKQIQTLTRTRDVLLPQLMSGKLRITE